MDLHGRSLLKETDLCADEFIDLVDFVRDLRNQKREGKEDEHGWRGATSR